MHWLLYFTLILMKCGDIEVNPGPSSVTEGEFLRLAQLIPPGYYKDVGIHLGIPDAVLDHIIVQHSSDYKDALMSVFIRWRDEQRPDEDIRALLAEGLEKSDLGGLSKEVLAGNGIQKRPDVAQATATTSRPSTSTGAAYMSAPPQYVNKFIL
nr:uncharacterized protein LOC129267112 [Lytechinus pictus]